MLEVTDLVVRYGTVEAVHGISLRVGKGEAVGVIGPNGAGKSSTLRAICAVAPIASGSILLHGTSLRGRSPEQIVAAGVALVPEGRRVFDKLTVAENLAVAAGSRRSRAGGDRQAEVLDLFPVLRRDFGKTAGLLSGGEQQQLAIARALLCRPDILLLDEPSFGLAPRIVETLFEALDRLRDAGLSIVIVEQMVTRVLDFTDRCYVFANGRVVTSGTREQVRSLDDFERTYLGIAP